MHISEHWQYKILWQLEVCKILFPFKMVSLRCYWFKRPQQIRMNTHRKGLETKTWGDIQIWIIVRSCKGCENSFVRYLMDCYRKAEKWSKIGSMYFGAREVCVQIEFRRLLAVRLWTDTSSSLSFFSSLKWSSMRVFQKIHENAC